MRCTVCGMGKATDWLFMVGAPTATAIWQWHASGCRGPNPLGSVAVPYADGDTAVGDVLYVCRVDWPGHRFTLMGRLEARSVRRVARDTRQTALVVAKRGSATKVMPVSVPQATVDALRFLHFNGTEHHVKRGPAGEIRSGQFGGKGNLRELVAGSDLLDAALEP